MKVCYLTEQYRQGDENFIGILNAIRERRVNESVLNLLQTRFKADLQDEKATKLYSHNINVDAENKRELEKLPGKQSVYYMESRGPERLVSMLKKGCLAPEALAIKKGAKVMFVKNNFEMGYANGTLGTVVDFSNFGSPIVETIHGRKIEATGAGWVIEENGKNLAEIRQLPLRLAWAITIHKSQGMTLDAAEINLENAFENGMGYVALSRVRSLQGIRLLGLNHKALQVNEEVWKFDKELQIASEETRNAI